MAKFTDEERTELIKKVADYIIKEKSSTRKTAKEFKISNATVSVWMNNLLIKKDRQKFILVQEVLHQNKPKTIKDEYVKNRVLNAAELIKNEFTVSEIAQALGVTEHVINEDLQTRLPRISEELSKEIKDIQKRNSLSNLKNVGKR